MTVKAKYMPVPTFECKNREEGYVMMVPVVHLSHLTMDTVDILKVIRWAHERGFEWIRLCNWAGDQVDLPSYDGNELVQGGTAVREASEKTPMSKKVLYTSEQLADILALIVDSGHLYSVSYVEGLEDSVAKEILRGTQETIAHIAACVLAHNTVDGPRSGVATEEAYEGLQVAAMRSLVVRRALAEALIRDLGGANGDTPAQGDAEAVCALRAQAEAEVVAGPQMPPQAEPEPTLEELQAELTNLLAQLPAVCAELKEKQAKVEPCKHRMDMEARNLELIQAEVSSLSEEYVRLHDRLNLLRDSIRKRM